MVERILTCPDPARWLLVTPGCNQHGLQDAYYHPTPTRRGFGCWICRICRKAYQNKRKTAALAAK